MKKFNQFLMENKNVMYTGIFVNETELINKYKPVHPNIFYHHSTIEFQPKNIDQLEIGKKIKLKILGRLTTNKVDALIVENVYSKNKFPHITLSTANGIKPFESNKEIENNLHKVIELNDYIYGVIGYFDGNEIITK